jgi:hypothetical protein
MQSKDITEILKVFEKRITKLEQRMGELEFGADDIRAAKSKELKEKDTYKTLDSRFDELSTTSRDVRQPMLKRVTYDKKALNSIRPTASEDSELTGFTDIERSATLDLEEGEVYESFNLATPVGSPSSGKPRSQQKSSKSDGDGRDNGGKDRKRGNRDNGRVKREKLGQQFKTAPLAVAPLERASSEPIKGNTSSGEMREESCKAEMHYGLLVQYPIEDK